MTHLESLIETKDVTVARMHGPARDPFDGAHRSLVVYVRAGVSTVRLAQLLHEAASRLERSNPGSRNAA